MDYFFELGFKAYEAGKGRAPMLAPEMHAALAHSPVGDPFTLEIMREYTRGWDSAAEVAADAVLAAS